jgi:hypothetical protein
LEVVTLVVAALTLQAVGREGTVTGTVTLNGTSVPLTHVYASAQPGFFDKKAEDVHVLLSDVPLADDTRADTFAMIHLARDGKARIVEVVIDASGAPIGGSIFARDFDGMVSVTGMHKFTRDRLERSTIAGRFAMDGPHEFMGVKFQYEARFSAPIPRPPTVEELGAALQSPPARAAAAYVAAVRRGDLGAFLTTLAEPLAASYRTSDGAARLREQAADMPADTRVTAVTPQTDASVLVEVEGHRAADRMVIGHTLRMVLENGAWKVGK